MAGVLLGVDTSALKANSVILRCLACLQYAAVRKAFFLFYEPVGVARGSSSRQEAGHTPGQPFRLQSLFQSVRVSDYWRTLIAHAMKECTFLCRFL